MRQEGQLSQWDDAKGYGFIVPKAGGARVFAHIKDFALRAERPVLGSRLSFEVALDSQGKRRAVKVRLIPVKAATAAVAASAADVAGARRARALLLVPVFAAFYLACHLAWGLPPAVWGLYMALSLATFVVYAGDKRAARRGEWRVSEGTLHGLALAGGWPGALLAQQMLRHKSSKASFRRMFWCTVFGNWLMFVLAAAPAVRAALVAAIRR
ncbi:DUF1294 domain-containing protein [Roseateles koreensis]|uniref:DUF1294 domain-containing protein n=1 Tax=Roseateles koreensis TaxID=2987526 RepID=A0ABT5KW61_9BURK|nr:DUF1294 domain-containing protein [Roseateles koreensis]MDC8787188.1 DUF1294 domain-containing protein [Roseateles koreensis]